ncbi:ABC transporter substrate-binding protein [Williamsia sterculiae]|uniref:Iron complex transport system substrate-binding protein n=1 Tax=Williamsia sterculiae TaxID=1344003 RepID=A0A1N7CQB4_9NOCA|nr:ABC transporter substrate-binding protein [Williamsia sterculiae]SIR65799.1 iron complex transport system substrate-binding protein [Williamsia sterculiae]
MRRLTIALTGVVLAVATACSAPAETSDSTSSSAKAESGALPVTISHLYGSTTIDKQPSRIATMGPGDGDLLLALGLKPTTLTPFADASGKTNVFPWNEKYIDKANPPAVLGTATSQLGDTITQALATNPDLILAVNQSVTKDQYASLSKAAPTLLHDAKYQDWQVPWTSSTEEIGKAIGMPAATEKLIDQTRQKYADAKKQHPEMVGKTAAVVIGGADGSVSLYSPGDGRGQTLTNLGYTFPDSLKPALSGGFYGDISNENLGMLSKLDKLVVVDWEGATEKVKANPAFQALDVVKRGDVVYADQVTGSAMSVPTVLTIPWVVDQLVPELTAKS